ncbi:hypothetical protein M3Y99_01136000 [Aphelenchoides fujianensis]|nr:hypothetical protein M3Y99_01136000 [Aphelenchoides fujianensis]
METAVLSAPSADVPRTPLNSRLPHPTAAKNHEMPPQFMEKRSQPASRYPAVQNRLAEQDHKPLNQTYTLGTHTNTQRQSAARRQRSGSIDSDVGDYSFPMSKTIVGIFPRTYGGTNSQLSSYCRKPGNPQSQTLMLSTKLPSLDGCSPERICCQRPWTRTQFELKKFQETLKHLN